MNIKGKTEISLKKLTAKYTNVLFVAEFNHARVSFPVRCQQAGVLSHSIYCSFDSSFQYVIIRIRRAKL